MIQKRTWFEAGPLSPPFVARTLGFVHDGWLVLEPDERRSWSESFYKIQETKIATFLVWIHLTVRLMFTW